MPLCLHKNTNRDSMHIQRQTAKYIFVHNAFTTANAMFNAHIFTWMVMTLGSSSRSNNKYFSKFLGWHETVGTGNIMEKSDQRTKERTFSACLFCQKEMICLISSWIYWDLVKKKKKSYDKFSWYLANKCKTDNWKRDNC